MQPYFLPYIGYFQLINAVDTFVVYDDIQFSKKGWFHRNRMLQNEKDEYFTLNLRKDSDYLNVIDRELSDNWPKERAKILRKINANYSKAPFFSETFPIIKWIFEFEEKNLFRFTYHSILEICSLLSIDTEIIISSSLNVNPDLKGEDRVIETVKNVNGNYYLNPIGGYDLYNPGVFKKEGIELRFHKSLPLTYPQFGNEFVPWLSILDLLMFNSTQQIKKWLDVFEILNKDE